MNDWFQPLDGGWRALSVAEQIASKVGELILVETMKPGEQITEVSLAQQFGVSRGPVRDALRLLENEGLVEITPRKGAQVTLLTAQEVTEVFDIRALLLGHASRLVARKKGEGCLPLLKEGLAELTANFKGARDIDLHLRVSLRMKRLICEHSENTRLVRLVGQLVRQTARYSRLALSPDSMRQKSIDTWKDLVHFIEIGDEVSAERLERGRVIEFKDKAIELIEITDSALSRK